MCAQTLTLMLTHLNLALSPSFVPDTPGSLNSHNPRIRAIQYTHLLVVPPCTLGTSHYANTPPP